MATTLHKSKSKNKGQKKRIVYIDENAPKRPHTAYVHFVKYVISFLFFIYTYYGHIRMQGM